MQPPPRGRWLPGPSRCLVPGGPRRRGLAQVCGLRAPEGVQSLEQEARGVHAQEGTWACGRARVHTRALSSHGPAQGRLPTRAHLPGGRSAGKPETLAARESQLFRTTNKETLSVCCGLSREAHSYYLAREQSPGGRQWAQLVTLSRGPKEAIIQGKGTGTSPAQSLEVKGDRCRGEGGPSL